MNEPKNQFTSLTALNPVAVQRHVANALTEDLGDGGDLTSQTCISPSVQWSGQICARKPGTIAGLALASEAFQSFPGVMVHELVSDGAAVAKGTPVLSVEGSARGILMAERVALNFLGHLSGIATATADLVAQTKGTKAKIACTRKTTPGLRLLEKYAVRCGGGFNHRFGLYDAVMIKDNHIAACGSITKALQAAKSGIGHTVKIEIEVDTLDQLDEVLHEGADIILLDNMSTDDLRDAVARTKGRAILEASGNVTVSSVSAIAATGVDVISSGWITHSAPTLDLGLDTAEK